MLRRLIPWWAKMGAKILLSRMPVGYKLWQVLGVFRHGRMDDSDYARWVFDRHVERAGLATILDGKTVLELGPGDSVATAVIAAAHGARAILVDSAAFAKSSVRQYLPLARQLADSGLKLLDLERCGTLDELLDVCGARYLTKGLNSLRELPSNSVDFIFSQAVLEHIRKAELPPTLAECRRILKTGGAFSNDIDLQDHLGGALNSLRFPEWWWESKVVASAGFYTNRLRYRALLEQFRAAGFEVNVTSCSRWDRLPTPLRYMQPEFRSLPYEDLRVYSFSVVLR